MKPQFSKKTPDRDEHECYVELCAVATSGTLTPGEREQLDSHLTLCMQCREVFDDFKHVIREGIPLLAEARDDLLNQTEDWSEIKTRQKVFARLENKELFADCRHGLILHSAAKVWKPSLMYAAATAICVSLFAAGYFIGSFRQPREVRFRAVSVTANDNLTAQIAQISKDRDQLEARLRDRARTIEDLSGNIAKQSRKIQELRHALQQAEEGMSRQGTELTNLGQENALIRRDRYSAGLKLQEAQSALASLQQDLKRIQAERAEALLKSASTEERFKDLLAEVNAHQMTVVEQQKLLASDRDIRELIGARDLLIADVYDNDKDGKTRKAFGRLFYTKNKSLVFYAFDLDTTPGINNAKTFQAWGEDGTGKNRPVNLGIFYLDNEANRRWVLRFDNPEVMQRINAVFVTVEPKASKEKPSGKQLLYAYLRTSPNHP